MQKSSKQYRVMVYSSIFLAIAALFALAPNLLAFESGNIIRVATNGSDFNGCGSEAQPCQTLQFALNAAQNDDEIRVAQGTYTSVTAEVLRVETNFTRSLNVKLVGGYSSNNWSSPSTDASKTVIDGQNFRRGIDIVADGGSTLNLHLENLAVMRGLVNNAVGFTIPLFVGAGLRCRDNNGDQSYGKVKVLMKNVLFKDNVVQGIGSETSVAAGGVPIFLMDVLPTWS